MQETTKRLHSKAMAEFMPVIEQMAQEGCDKNQIVGAFQSHIRHKTEEFYKRQREPKPFKDCFIPFETQSADSKAEMIFYEMLKKTKIKLSFQQVIGPYRADYVMNGFLVIEIDGPQHNKKQDDKRDSYLRKMGYKIIRIPIWVLTSCPEAVIQEIREASKLGIG